MGISVLVTLVLITLVGFACLVALAFQKPKRRK
jgi:hypothetical protein